MNGRPHAMPKLAARRGKASKDDLARTDDSPTRDIVPSNGMNNEEAGTAPLKPTSFMPETDPLTGFRLGGRKNCTCARLLVANLFADQFEQLPDHVHQWVGESSCEHWVAYLTRGAYPTPESIFLPDGTQIQVKNPLAPVASRTVPGQRYEQTRIALVIRDCIEEPGPVSDVMTRALLSNPQWCLVRDEIRRALPVIREMPNVMRLPEYVREHILEVTVADLLSGVCLPPQRSVTHWTIWQACGGAPPGFGISESVRPVRETYVTMFLELWPYTQGRLEHQYGRAYMWANSSGEPRAPQEAQKRFARFKNWVTRSLGVTLIDNFNLPRHNKGRTKKNDELTKRIKSHVASGKPDDELFAEEAKSFKAEYHAENGVAPPPALVKSNHEMIRQRLRRLRIKSHAVDIELKRI